MVLIVTTDRIIFNTNPGVNTVVRTPAAFNLAVYATPGTWSYSTSPR